MAWTSDVPTADHPKAVWMFHVRKAGGQGEKYWRKRIISPIVFHSSVFCSVAREAVLGREVA
jgi:hypothetical protein